MRPIPVAYTSCPNSFKNLSIFCPSSFILLVFWENFSPLNPAAEEALRAHFTQSTQSADPGGPSEDRIKQRRFEPATTLKAADVRNKPTAARLDRS
jgi:hypothetical protein